MKVLGLLLLTLSLSLFISAQNTASNQTPSGTGTGTAQKQSTIFRATKDQTKRAQAILKERNLYGGEASGKLDDAARIGLQKYQLAENLRITGTLNRETVEKMNIPLTDSQKGIPKQTSSDTGDKKPAVFRASKAQITEAQNLLKEKGFYHGDASGKLDDPTREGLKKYQATNEIKVTGTLNRETLQKMSIQLTEKQKVL